jgi:hypothetical protein
MLIRQVFAAAAVWLIALTGCTSTYSQKDVTAGAPPLLRTDSRIYIAIPFDATFKKSVAVGSGKATAQALYAAFARYSKGVYIGPRPESMSEALETARKYSADYLVYPNIIRWEDRATEWSGRRDRLELKVDLVDPKTSALVFSRNIQGTGKWMTDGGDTPTDLLPQPCDEFANALFRHVEKPSALW